MWWQDVDLLHLRSIARRQDSLATAGDGARHAKRRCSLAAVCTVARKLVWGLYVSHVYLFGRAVALGGSGNVYVGVNIEFPHTPLNNSVRTPHLHHVPQSSVLASVHTAHKHHLQATHPSCSPRCQKAGSRRLVVTYWPVLCPAAGIAAPAILCRTAAHSVRPQIHAEQCLLVNCLHSGETSIRALAVSAAPCGHCRWARGHGIASTRSVASTCSLCFQGHD